jgi:hypothetical protein
MSHRTVAGVIATALSLATVRPGLAAETCSCKHLESLQQELENAVYEAQFFAELSKRLQQVEQDQIEANKDPTNPDADRPVLVVSGQAKEKIMGSEFTLPHPEVKGDTGPASVDMTFQTCKQPQAQLDALEKGAACKEIGEIVLRHEAAHREKCEADGPKKYWDRLPSEIAAEEAERYQEQASAMRDLLKRVIDGGTIRVSADMEPRVTGPEFDVTYSYVTAPFDLEGKSAPGSDEWELNGDGTQVATIKRAKLGGMTCTGVGQLNDKVSVTLKTDGLGMSATHRLEGAEGDVGLRCQGGAGMSMRPPGEGGGGPLFPPSSFAAKSEFVEDVSTLTFAQILAQSGMSASGTKRVTVELVCPGQ